MSYILKLAGWYPSKVDLYNGDFVQRHAKSIALYKDIVVIYIVKDDTIKQVRIEQKTEGRLTEIIAYYPKKKWIDKLMSNFLYFKLFKKITLDLFKTRGLPQLVHVNILWKAGLLALRLKKKYELPYIITENWTGYYPEDPNYIVNNKLKWAIFKKVYRHATYMLPVTKDLGNRCNQLFGTGLPYSVVENSVDTTLFYPQAEQKKTIVHISTMGYQKNTIALLDVLPDILAKYTSYDVKLIGPSNEAVESKVNGLPQQIKARIHFTGNIPYTTVAQHVRQASLLVLFSRYENLPCVILESLCCGVPVVSTNVGGISEVINEQNGILVDSENTGQLQAALIVAMDNLNQFDKNLIADHAREKYSYESIGLKYSNAYSEILKQTTGSK